RLVIGGSVQIVRGDVATRRELVAIGVATVQIVGEPVAVVGWFMQCQWHLPVGSPVRAVG
ncbi:MAG: hypothetical protein ABI205_06100, partial [Gemmatimonadaceae bacterium]